MAKITKGKSFGGCVRYVLDKERAYLIETAGIHETDPEQMIWDFNLQTLLNPKVKNIVGHISLNFPVEDKAMATDDERLRLIARDYMRRMGIRNTQFLIARHTDKDHSHCHIIFNRVDNDGKTISDKNDRYRNEKVCKMLTAKYRLHFSEGKKNIKPERLRGSDALKHELFSIIKHTLNESQTLKDFEDNLSDKGVETTYKFNGSTKEIQGIKLEYKGQTFSGSKIDRQFSYGNLSGHFAISEHNLNVRQEKAQKEYPQFENYSSFGDWFSHTFGSHYDQNEEEVEQLRKKKKKQIIMKPKR